MDSCPVLPAALLTLTAGTSQLAGAAAYPLSGGMAALLLSAAGVLDESGADPAADGGWRWCDVCGAWAPGDWQGHVEGTPHQQSLRLIEVHLAST